MNHEEIYRKVREHLLGQGKVSASVLGCVYRSPEGLKCAIGCLISDEFYYSNLETRGIYDSSVQYAVEGSLEEKINWAEEKDFFQELQSIHDRCNPATWESELDSFWSKWNSQ